MKLSEIEAHVYLKKAVEPKLARVFEEPEEIKFIDYPVYTAEQMQEYAKECVRAALKILDNTILPIFEDDERVVMQKIFEEDTKND